MKILLIGPQGCGKGTVAETLSKKIALPHLSSGQMLRQMPENHPRYEEVQKHMEEGELVPQEIVAELLKKRVSQEDCKKGFILEGWFRCMKDVEIYDFKPDIVFLIEISKETSIKRITGRRICTSDGKIYNIYTLPKEELDKCTGDFIQREDDTVAVVERRQEIYEEDTLPVIEHLKQRGTPVYEIDGEQTPEEVFASVMKVLKPII